MYKNKILLAILMIALGSIIILASTNVSACDCDLPQKSISAPELFHRFINLFKSHYKLLKKIGLPFRQPGLNLLYPWLCYPLFLVENNPYRSAV